ncbi:MAG: universal stress protein [Actinomycetota bacterium]
MTSIHVPGRIVVPVDPSREPSSAVSVVGTLARQAGLAVEFVATRPPGVPQANVDAYLFQRCREAEEAGASDVSWTALDASDPADGICDVLTDDGVALVCLATRARGVFGEFVLGSVAEAVVRRSPVPVVLVGPEVEATPERYREFFVALDGSELAEHAAEVAAAVAQRTGSELFLLEVLDEVPPPDVAETAYLARVASTLEPKPGRYDAVHGRRPGEAILAMAGESPDVMVVMGTHGRSGLSRLVMGSVAHDVVHRARCPVVVVPQSAEKWEWPSPLV